MKSRAVSGNLVNKLGGFFRKPGRPVNSSSLSVHPQGRTPNKGQSSVPIDTSARPPSLIRPSGTPQELPDIGPIIGENWRHGSEPA
ncbi:hypothetical protein CO661_27220 [Sinorhizobium fredii]|uniref:Uncharacterized protein n=1 Tax=Rhizobium fredii TaxID=380 RepID=A0A2A6LQY1_RHIFR|nr:hypothetical protein CO661_27220 [Sinorhizobium fredii]